MIFLGGSVRVEAKSCEKGDDGCNSYEDIIISDPDFKLVCAYEVTIDKRGFFSSKEKTYFNMIYYKISDLTFYAVSSIDEYSKVTSKNILGAGTHPIISDSNLKNLMNSVSCPLFSYIDNDYLYLGRGDSELCFGSSDEDCESTTLNEFDVTVDSKIVYDDAISVKNYKVGYDNSCSVDNALLNQYGNVCKYRNSDRDYILLYYNDNSSLAVWTAGQKRYVIPNNLYLIVPGFGTPSIINISNHTPICPL